MSSTEDRDISPTAGPLDGPTPGTGGASSGESSLSVEGGASGEDSPSAAAELHETGAPEAKAAGEHVGPQGGSVALPADGGAPSALPPALASAGAPPSFRFFGVVAAVSLVADVATKAWAELVMNRRAFEPIELLDGHVNIILAYNRGGAWGLLQDASEMIRKPFFLGVSIAAILFIVSLYGRLTPSQRALKWGLPLVLGGALGNLSDRITRSQVIDFIDYRADWVMAMNSFVRRYVRTWTLTDHWPTFNVADIAICVGVGLMAIDMFSSRKQREGVPAATGASSEQSVSLPEPGDSSGAESRPH